jgi:hypothetical protein
MDIFVIMIRTIVRSDQNNLTISLPDDLVGKLIEVIAFEIDDTDKINNKPKPSQLRGFLSENSSKLMHNHINKSREEWDTL